MPHAVLKVLEGPLQGRLLPIAQSDVTIGRLKDCQIPLNEYVRTSREHARLTWSGSSFIIQDLKSTNGVLVNGQRVTTGQMVNGDVLQLGDFKALLQVPPGGPEFVGGMPHGGGIPPGGGMSPGGGIPSGAGMPPGAFGSPGNNYGTGRPPVQPARPNTAVMGAVGVIVLLVVVAATLSQRPRPIDNHITPVPTGSVSGPSDTPTPSRSSGPEVTPKVQSAPVGDSISSATVEQVKAATVLIAHPVQGGYVMGSGFCAVSARYIITNRHVVVGEDGGPVSCTIFFHSGTDEQKNITIDADHIRIMRKDTVADLPEFPTDLAIIELPEKVVDPLELGDTEDLHETQKLYAVGFPRGTDVMVLEKDKLPVTSVQSEEVQRLEQVKLKNGKHAVVMLQLGGSATHGNSGGPVVDANGKVVGVIQGGHDGSDIGYAIPTTWVKLFLSATGQAGADGAGHTQPDNTPSSGTP